MANEITLIDVLSGLEQTAFEKKYPGRRRKLRFNVSWVDKTPKGKVVQDFKEMYLNKSPNFEPWILSLGAGNRKRLNLSDIVFQFIEIEPHKWLFVGAYDIVSLDERGMNPATGVAFEYAGAKRIKEFDAFADRLVVDFKNKGQAFYYVDAKTIDKIKVLAILDEPYRLHADDFPGYEHVCRDFAGLSRCINKPEWKTALSSVFGVYVLTDTKTGKLYVGSATGQNGIYGRWSTYLDKGYDDSDRDYPNKRLKELVKSKGFDYIKANFQYSILETFPKTDMGRDKALARESYWKNVFQTRVFGYNDN